MRSGLATTLCSNANMATSNGTLFVGVAGAFLLADMAITAHLARVRLFPIRKHGTNVQSQVLQLHEIEAIKADP